MAEDGPVEYASGAAMAYRWPARSGVSMQYIGQPARNLRTLFSPAPRSRPPASADGQASLGAAHHDSADRHPPQAGRSRALEFFNQVLNQVLNQLLNQLLKFASALPKRLRMGA